MCEISPDHRFLAYTIVAWAKDGHALVYVVTDSSKRPFRVFCSVLGSSESDVMLMEELDETCYINIRNTKDYQFITVNSSSSTSSEVCLINAEDIGAGMHKVWECEPDVDCVLEHHQGYLYMFTDAPRDRKLVDGHYLLRRPVAAFNSSDWENVFLDEPNLAIEDVDFFDKHMVLTLRKGRIPALCSLSLPLPVNLKGGMHLNDLSPCFLPVPKDVCQISPGPNYDFYSSVVRLVISSPVMPDAVVDYNLSSREWVIVQQQDVIAERAQVLYGGSSSTTKDLDASKSVNKFVTKMEDNCEDWNDLSEFYMCEHRDVLSTDNVYVPLTVVYSHKIKKDGQNPGILHGHGAYGELLDKRWRNDLKSLLDRGWVIAFADVRGGGGAGKRWHHEGRASKKFNSIHDYIACAKFLVEEEYIQNNKLAAWGCSAGGLLVGAAINMSPDLFRAAILKVPFLDSCNTLLEPIIPLGIADYEEFGDPDDPKEFESIQSYSPYENIQRGVAYPAVLVTSSFKTRFGVWEAAKWIARVREYANRDPSRPVLLNVSTDIVEENRYLQCKETALEHAFLIKVMGS
eukprot:Gb_38885 [translate_table: standard]